MPFSATLTVALVTAGTDAALAVAVSETIVMPAGRPVPPAIMVNVYVADAPTASVPTFQVSVPLVLAQPPLHTPKV